MIIHGDALEELKKIEEDSVDFICTDPPYGYNFMGKHWDKAVPSIELWQECLRVLKPGGFINVMSAPRSDVLSRMIVNIEDAGFRVDFTPIYWTYASGFPKAGNIGKLVDKRLGVEQEIAGPNPGYRPAQNEYNSWRAKEGRKNSPSSSEFKKKATSEAAKALDGSYAGFQPKPAVEVIIVAMKPLSEKTYVDQALANSKGISWLDDGRIGTSSGETKTVNYPHIRGDNYAQGKGAYNDKSTVEYQVEDKGRFPANLLVEDRVLGEYSRYFDIGEWASTLPFLICPKASKSEKNKGLDGLPEKFNGNVSQFMTGTESNWIQDARHPNGGYELAPAKPRANHHPTVKPLRLMSYLITLFSRPGDTVLDPFLGSGTTCVAAKELGREFIGIEREAEYADIAEARLEAIKEPEPRLL